MNLEALIKAIKDFIEEAAPALAVILWDYKTEQVNQARHEAMEAQLNFQLEKNHEQIDKENLGKSDMDILDAAINGGQGQSGGGQSHASNQADAGKSSGSGNSNKGSGTGT